MEENNSEEGYGRLAFCYVGKGEVSLSLLKACVKQPAVAVFRGEKEDSVYVACFFSKSRKITGSLGMSVTGT